MKTFVLFIQGGGEGAYEADAVLAKSLQRALGDEYDVRYPQMPDESNPDMQTWKTKISRELEALNGRVMLVGHSMGGATVLKISVGRKRCETDCRFVPARCAVVG